jgi:hypothetical protein
MKRLKSIFITDYIKGEFIRMDRNWLNKLVKFGYQGRDVKKNRGMRKL